MKKKNPAAVALGRLGGSVKSEAKARAARENGKRPKKKKRWRGTENTPQPPAKKSREGS